MGRPVKYKQKLINKVHRDGFIKNKLSNSEIEAKYNLTANQLDYVLYQLKCTNKDCWLDECGRCNPPKTITQSIIDFFTMKDV